MVLSAWSHGRWYHHHNDLFLVTACLHFQQHESSAACWYFLLYEKINFFFLSFLSNTAHRTCWRRGEKKWRWKQWIISREQSAPQINSNKKTGGESLTPAQLVNVPDVTTSCLAASPADTEMKSGMMARHLGGNLALDAFWIPNQWQRPSC